MKLLEIVAAAKATNPELFASVRDPLAARIVGAALQEIAKQVEATAEGPLVVAGLGKFVAKRIRPKTSSGAPSAVSAAPVRRVLFHARTAGRVGAGKAAR